MQFYNVRLLGSLAAFVLLGVNAGQAQFPAASPSSLPLLI